MLKTRQTIWKGTDAIDRRWWWCVAVGSFSLCARTYTPPKIAFNFNSNVTWPWQIDRDGAGLKRYYSMLLMTIWESHFDYCLEHSGKCSVEKLRLVDSTRLAASDAKAAMVMLDVGTPLLSLSSEWLLPILPPLMSIIVHAWCGFEAKELVRPDACWK